MIKILLATMLLTAGCACMNIKTQPLNENAVFIKGANGTASGVFISSNEEKPYILTNAHVCQINHYYDGSNEPYLSIHTHDGYILKAVDVAISEYSDLCLMQLTTKEDYEGVRLAARPAEFGDKVYTSGYPIGVRSNFEGYVSKWLAGDIFGLRFRGVSITSYGGSSGSGIVNEYGHLVGVVAIGYVRHPGLTGMVDLVDIVAFLKPYVEYLDWVDSI